jgi:hypothetical protein
MNVSKLFIVFVSCALFVEIATVHSSIPVISNIYANETIAKINLKYRTPYAYDVMPFTELTARFKSDFSVAFGVERGASGVKRGAFGMEMAASGVKWAASGIEIAAFDVKRAASDVERTASGIEWVASNGIYKVEFDLPLKDCKAYYNLKENLLITVEEISRSDLPAVVENAVKAEYPQYSFEDIYKISRRTKIFYKIDMKLRDTEVELALQSNGTVLQEKINC